MTARLGYDVNGPASGEEDAPVLVLGSSLGTTRVMWRPQLEPFAERLRVVRFDHRGHGASAEPPGPYTIADLGRDVLAMLGELGVRHFSYAGVSLGGMVGIWLAANAAERVDRLALCCTTAYLPPAQAWRDRAATVLASGMAAIADAVVARWFTPAFAADHPDVVAEMHAGLVAAPPVGYAACCEAIAAMDQREDLYRITAPTLVLAGTQDQAIPVDHSERLVEAVPGSRLALVHGAHLATLEAAAESTALLLDHLLPGQLPDHTPGQGGL
jgi:3-oxoadipate enol-lactonase